MTVFRLPSRPGLHNILPPRHLRARSPIFGCPPACRILVTSQEAIKVSNASSSLTGRRPDAYLVEATPWKQQLGEIIGVLTAAGALAGVIHLCNDRCGFLQDADHPNALLAPQANLMKLLVRGVVDQELRWPLTIAGTACALVVELLGIPSLPFAVGLYLPLSLSTPIMDGGALRWLIQRRNAAGTPEGQDSGILASSGLVAGYGLMGVIFVGVAALIG